MYLVESNIQRPAGREVVVIPEPLPAMQTELRERDIPGVLVEHYAAQLGDAVIPPVNVETVQVLPTPVEG